MLTLSLSIHILGMMDFILILGLINSSQADPSPESHPSGHESRRDGYEPLYYPEQEIFMWLFRSRPTAHSVFSAGYHQNKVDGRLELVGARDWRQQKVCHGENSHAIQCCLSFEIKTSLIQNLLWFFSFN